MSFATKKKRYSKHSLSYKPPGRHPNVFCPLQPFDRTQIELEMSDEECFKQICLDEDISCTDCIRIGNLCHCSCCRTLKIHRQKQHEMYLYLKKVEDEVTKHLHFIPDEC